MKQASEHAVGKCFGSTVVGPRGQLVIPVEARRELGVEAGTRLLVFSHFRDEGLIFVKVEAVAELIDHASRQIKEVASLVKEARAADAEEESEGHQG